MKKFRFFLYVSIISLCACSSPENPTPQPEPAKDFTVEFISETLKINNLEAKENVNYEAIISFKEENYNYCLPTNITILIGKKRINEDKYTYNKDLGYIFIDKALITGNLKIYAERVVVAGYQINFETDSHIHFYFYPTRNYEVAPIEDTIAIARDLDGKPITDGTGEVNFKYTVDGNYDTDLFWIRGMSDEMEEVETGIYRIANIKSNIRVCANSKKIYCKNLCASADYNNHSFTFSWGVKNPSDVNNVQITIKHDGATETDTASGTSYTYNNVQNESLYQFIFTPKLNDGTLGNPVEKDMMLSPDSRDAAFPRVEITTENNLLPHYDIVHDPSGRLNVSTVNNNYTQNIIKIYNDQNINVYDSSGGDPTYFDGSKIKVRGNTSTVESNGKESYKIKLKTKADLLDPFLNRSAQTGGDAYKDKEWLLLNCGNQLNELGGFSIENTLKDTLSNESVAKKDWWVPQCQYVTLFMNNDFKGIYILCEAVTVGNDSETEPTVHSRCPISEDGFIIENDAYGWTENLTFKTRIYELMPSLEYTFKYPDVDDLIEEGGYESEKYQYISNKIKEFENYFYIAPVDSRYKNYIDVESFALWTVAHDLMHVDDYLGSNMYIYKKDSSENSKLVAGTTWDFDSAFIGNLDDTSAKGLCFHRSSFCYYIRIFKNIDEFVQDTQDIFNAAKDKIITDFDDYISYISNRESVYNELLAKEALRFDKPQVQFEDQVNQIEHYLQVQIKYINEHPYEA